MDILILIIVGSILVISAFFLFKKKKYKIPETKKEIYVSYQYYSTNILLEQITEVNSREKLLFLKLKDRSIVINEFLKKSPLYFGNIIHNNYLYTELSYRSFNEISNILVLTYQNKYKI